MKSLVIRALFGAFACSSSYFISGSFARADDWGCQTILCLSNPSGLPHTPNAYVPFRGHGASC